MRKEKVKNDELGSRHDLEIEIQRSLARITQYPARDQQLLSKSALAKAERAKNAPLRDPGSQLGEEKQNGSCEDHGTCRVLLLVFRGDEGLVGLNLKRPAGWLESDAAKGGGLP